QPRLSAQRLGSAWQSEGAGHSWAGWLPRAFSWPHSLATAFCWRSPCRCEGGRPNWPAVGMSQAVQEPEPHFAFRDVQATQTPQRGLSMRTIAFGCLAWVWLVASPARAAESEPLDNATVVQGKVRTVFLEEVAEDAISFTIMYEVVVEKAEKARLGDELKEGKVIFAQTQRFREGLKPGTPLPVIPLPFVRPARGDTVQVYCDRQDDGHYRVRMNPTAIKIIKRA